MTPEQERLVAAMMQEQEQARRPRVGLGATLPPRASSH
jgi:hypothetical protein